MTADVLSDVLRVLRLTGAVYFDFELTAPWVAEAPPSCDIAAIVMPGAQRVIEYHLIAGGACWGHAIGQEPMRLHEGDLIVFPQGDAHVLSSAPGMRHAPNLAMFERGPVPLPLYYELGGGGERTHVVCCFLGCDDRPFNPLLAALPSVIHLSATNPRPGVPTAWLRSLFDIAVKESASRRAGRENMLARVSELMFVETVRGYLEGLPDTQTGWLAGVRDPLVGRALTSLHAEPRRPWTVERLARHVGASRSVLAERFTTMVGQPPMQYLALWRMQIASRAILDGGPIASIAESVGYESEAAFSRAFKKLVGQSPATWRKRAGATRDEGTRGPADEGR
ncbi:MAG TPA: AraC family transcriptional regulator [Vicinamibacterales bacterium]|jgi:AraC-like DNA-binding protein|nr:AraC family transcriptional regulator [Vicinamibacterales bacterium]